MRIRRTVEVREMSICLNRHRRGCQVGDQHESGRQAAIFELRSKNCVKIRERVKEFLVDSV